MDCPEVSVASGRFLGGCEEVECDMMKEREEEEEEEEEGEEEVERAVRGKGLI